MKLVVKVLEGLTVVWWHRCVIESIFWREDCRYCKTEKEVQLFTTVSLPVNEELQVENCIEEGSKHIQPQDK